MVGAEEAAFTYNEEVIGVEVIVGSAVISREYIARYCEAIEDTNPLYIDEQAAAAGQYGTVVAPLGLLSTIPTAGWLDPEIKFGNSAFAAGARMQAFAPVMAGDEITVYGQIKEVYAKTGRSGTMVFSVRRSTFQNQDGAVVAILDFSGVQRQV